jgi:hypothetical protein
MLGLMLRCIFYSLTFVRAAKKIAGVFPVFLLHLRKFGAERSYDLPVLRWGIISV